MDRMRSGDIELIETVISGTQLDTTYFAEIYMFQFSNLK